MRTDAIDRILDERFHTEDAQLKAMRSMVDDACAAVTAFEAKERRLRHFLTACLHASDLATVKALVLIALGTDKELPQTARKR